MNEWWELLTAAEKVFWSISIVFSVLFVIQFILSLIGIDADTDVDIDVDSDMDPGYGMDADFTFFSVRSIIAFFTFFGWTGVMALKNDTGVVVAVTLALLAGFAAMFIVAYMMFKFTQLDSSGTYRIDDAVNEEAEVYLTIPEKIGGTGLIHIKINGATRELPATTHGKALPTGSPVRVVDILENNILLVEPMPLLDLPGEAFG